MILYLVWHFLQMAGTWHLDQWITRFEFGKYHRKKLQLLSSLYHLHRTVNHATTRVDCQVCCGVIEPHARCATLKAPGR